VYCYYNAQLKLRCSQNKKLDSTMSQLNPTDILTHCACKFHFRVIAPSTS